MNFKTFSLKGVICVMNAMAAWTLTAAPSAQGDSSLEEIITSTSVFEQPILWVGESTPANVETLALWNALETNTTQGRKGMFYALDQFIETYPESSWSPSLRANLALVYRKQGRFTKALEYWKEAWKSIEELQDNNATLVGNFVLAKWPHVLASLGRIEELEEILKSAKDRNLENSKWQRSFNTLDHSLDNMKNNPGIAFKCGTFALSEVAKSMGLDSTVYRQLHELPSPSSGFSLSKLVELSDSLNLGLIAVERKPVSKQIVVPSVVHWRQNHYAAIIDKHNELYRVKDPTFGSTQWMTPETINEEASGYFMISKDVLGNDWQELPSERTSQIFGKGLDYGPPIPPCPQGFDFSCGFGGGPGGGDGSGGCGMPEWWVSEPYISLWLLDKPMFYRTSNGQEMAFKINYHSDEHAPGEEFSSYYDRRGYETNIFNIGPYWNINFQSYVELVDVPNVQESATFDPLFSAYLAHAYGPGGGALSFNYETPDIDFQTFIRFEKIDNGTKVTSVKLHHPGGSVWDYEVLTPHPDPSVEGKWRFFLSQITDPQGFTTTFNYTTNDWVIYLDSVVDRDGFTNTFSYATNSIIPTQISSIKDRFGREVFFNYATNSLSSDMPSLLTNIVDVIGISTTFDYMYTNADFFITNYATPYGNTGFQYLSPGGELFGTSSGNDNINRAILVSETNSVRHIFMFKDAPSSSSSSSTPIEYSDAPPIGAYNYHMGNRNSFYWGPNQMKELTTTNLTSLTTNDYNRARLRNWLHQEEWGTVVAPVRSMERTFGFDGVNPGHKTWFTYWGGGGNYSGTNNSPQFISQNLPDGQTNFVYRQYNYRGNITLEAQTYTQGGILDYRTNTFEYSTDGIDLLKSFDAEGRLVQSNAFNGFHQMVTNFNAAGDLTTYSYNANYRLSQITYPSGLTRNYHYFTNGLYAGYLASIIDAEIGATNSYTYTNSLLYQATDPRGWTKTYRYDDLGRVLSITFPDNTYSSNQYSYLDLTGIKDREGHWTHYAYNSLRQLLYETNALGNVKSYSYCDCGALGSITDFGNNSTSFEYDFGGRLKETHYPDGYSVTNNLDSMGRVVWTSDSAGMSVTNWYNNQGHLVTASNSFGQMFRRIYDIHDKVHVSTDQNGVSITNVYDAMGRLVSRTAPSGGVEGFFYSTNGLARLTNQLGKVSWFAYDAGGRRTAETNANTEVTLFSYNAAGDLLTLTDGKGHDTSWNYDLEGQATNKVSETGSTLFIYSYDANGRLTSRWSNAKGTTSYAYDDLGNLTSVDYAVSPDLTFQYDALNRLTNMIDGLGTTSYTYDSVGLLLSEDGPWANDTVIYTYEDRLLTAMSVEEPNASSWSQAYDYDDAHRISTLSSPAGSFSYQYSTGLGGLATSSALVKQLGLPNGSSITNGFDTTARIFATHLLDSGSTLLNSHDYTYNDANQRTKQVFKSGNYFDYTYDDIGQLETAIGKESDTTERGFELLSYVYDDAGNLQYRTNNALIQTFNVNSVNALTTVSRSGTLHVAGTTTSQATDVTVNGQFADLYDDATFFASVSETNTFTAVAMDAYGREDTDIVTAYMPTNSSFIYDGNGNLRIGLSGTFYDYDDENQLIRVYRFNDWKSEFTYDGKMRRRVRTEYLWVNSAWQTNEVVRYIYDGNLVVQERDGDNIPEVDYTRGLDLSGTSQGAGGIGGLLARSQRRPIDDEHAYYHADGNGNITALVDPIESIVARYHYDPFGKLTSLSGPLAEANLYRFSSKEFHAPSEMIYYLYRFYDPALQRWPNRDPIGERGGINLYAFVYNSPVNLIDSDGRAPMGWPVLPPPGAPPSILPIPNPPPLNNPNAQRALEWLRKCHPELAPEEIIESDFWLPMFDWDGFGVPFSRMVGGIVYIVPGQTEDDYVNTIAHEGMHTILGPAPGKAHDNFHFKSREIEMEFWSDPNGDNCKCKNNHPGASPPPPQIDHWTRGIPLGY